MRTTWKKLITEELENQSETWDELIHTTLTESQLENEFDDSYGHSQGLPFTLWTERRVYFPVVYDGSEWVGSVPRYPGQEATAHIGG